MMSALKFKYIILISSLSFFSMYSCISYADNFDKMRSKALNIIKNGQVNKGLKVIEAIASKGDIKSIIIAGSLHLKGKNVSKDYSRAHYWFKKGAEKCDEKSILILEKYFYKRRGGEYFDPQKIDYIKNKCIKKEQKDVEIVENKPKKNKTYKKQKSQIISNNDKSINTQVTRSWQNIAPQSGKIIGGGSGFAVNKNGYFLTNEHVIDKCDSVRIRYNELYGSAKVINVHESLDAAILKVNALTPYFAKFDNNEYKAGEKLYAAGFPAEDVFNRGMSFSEGMLTNPETSRSRIKTEGTLLMSVPIASGNSGGPVINKYGAIRGMVVSGWEIDKIRKKLKKDKIFTSNVTFNMMISGNLLKNWLDKNRINITQKYSLQPKLDSDVIGQMAKRFLGNIECVKNE
jgi:hypothetical protein